MSTSRPTSTEEDPYEEEREVEVRKGRPCEDQLYGVVNELDLRDP